jgi:hypothetical protein
LFVTPVSFQLSTISKEEMMTQSIIGLAETVEENVHEHITSAYGEGGGFELPAASLFGVELDAEGNFVDTCYVTAHPDVYDLLERPASELSTTFTTFAIVTTGWAAPLNDDGEVDGAPSKHPKRRRVRLVITANIDGVASVLRFEDDSDNVIVDPGQGTGSLAEAVMNFVAN